MIFQVRDYFSKYGFQDGDNQILKNFANKIFPEVSQWILEGLSKYSTIFREADVELLDIGTAHNDLRAEIRWIEMCGNYKMSMMWDDKGPGVHLDDIGIFLFGYTCFRFKEHRRNYYERFIKEVLENAQNKVEEKYRDEIEKIPILD